MLNKELQAPQLVSSSLSPVDNEWDINRGAHDRVRGHAACVTSLHDFLNSNSGNSKLALFGEDC